MLFEALGKLKHQIIISSVLMMILGLLLLMVLGIYVLVSGDNTLVVLSIGGSV